uniref:DsbA family protein n=1 Tax=Nonomuraea pusilla TaxID=46177 RepID=UPI0006E1C4FE|nr:DsbA family protein [Nonomuraea pusilla]
MRIEIWADVICGWAHVGRRRLAKALASWDGEPVETVWRPYLIDPTAPSRAASPADEPEDADAPAACAVPGAPPAETGAPAADLSTGPGAGAGAGAGFGADSGAGSGAGSGAVEGLGPASGAEWRADSRPAHRLIALAYESGGSALQDAVVERVFRAHFVDVVDIGDPAVLARLAEEAGFADGPALLAAGAGEALLRELLLVGKAIGVTTSPTIVANGIALAGAQPPAVIAEFLADAAGRTPRRLPAEVERLRRAESLLDMRDPLGALTLLGPLLDEHGEDRGVRMLAARAYFASAQLNRARTALERLVAESPDDSYARHLLGRTLQRQGRHEEAATHLAMAAAMTPDYTVD